MAGTCLGGVRYRRCAAPDGTAGRHSATRSITQRVLLRKPEGELVRQCASCVFRRAWLLCTNLAGTSLCCQQVMPANASTIHVLRVGAGSTACYARRHVFASESKRTWLGPGGQLQAGPAHSGGGARLGFSVGFNVPEAPPPVANRCAAQGSSQYIAAVS